LDLALTNHSNGVLEKAAAELEEGDPKWTSRVMSLRSKWAAGKAQWHKPGKKPITLFLSA
jgi:hypothetical protein